MKKNGYGCMVGVQTEGALTVTGEGENKVVVDTRKATVLFGGSHLDLKTDSGAVMSGAEFDERWKSGVTCVHNPTAQLGVKSLGLR